MTGSYLVHGLGVTESYSEGLVYLTLAAERGSNLAAYKLGRAKAEGSYGLAVNKKEAIYWLEKCLSPLSCSTKHLSAVATDKARQKLQELLDDSTSI